MHNKIEAMGSIILVAIKSRKSNIVCPQMVYSDHEPTDKEQIVLKMNSGKMTIKHALVRRTLNRSCTNAIDTSASEIVDVNAATVINRKNSTDHSRVNGICANISGKVTKTRAEPANWWSESPKVITPGNIIIPIRNATRRSRSDTVRAVRVSLVDFG